MKLKSDDAWIGRHEIVVFLSLRKLLAAYSYIQ